MTTENLAERSGPVTIHRNLDALPPAILHLLHTASSDSFFHSPAWFQALARHGYDKGAEVRVYAAGNGAPRVALVADVRLPAGRFGPRTLSAFANYYSCLYGVAIAPGEDSRAVAVLVDALVDERPRWQSVHLHSLDMDDPSFGQLTQAFRRRGWPVQTYFQFGNWFEPTAGVDADTYVKSRPGQLRNTVKRHEAKLARAAKATFDFVNGGADLESAIADYEAVYSQSWKVEEPFPEFAKGLARSAAEAGALRLGIAHVDGAPAAAQLWIVWRGKATIYKLAHDKRFDELSIGTILTMRMMRHVLDTDRPVEVDFGRGDDPYKRLWLSKRRERWGIIAFNPATARGAAAAARHMAGRFARTALNRLNARRPPADGATR